LSKTSITKYGHKRKS